MTLRRSFHFSRPAFEIALAAVGVWAGCAAAPSPSTHNGPIEMPAQPAAAAPNGDGSEAKVQPQRLVIEDDPVILATGPDGGAASPALPVSWSVTFGHTRPFAEAMHLATDARRSFDRASASLLSSATTDAGAGAALPIPAPKQFERASSLLDQGSRLYAAAYHAPNASMNNRIDTLHDAADMILAWSRKLDEAGLARAPATYRSDPAVSLTFEDVANGPAKRWREEGIALLHLCIELAKTNNVDSNTSRGCASMRHTYARVIVQRPAPAAATARAATDGGTVATGCACDPGDPLCSASMSGWCRPTK